MIQQCPSIVRQSLTKQIMPFVEYLKDELSISMPAIGKIAASFPPLFSIWIQANANNVLKFLKNLGLSNNALINVIQKRPQLLSLRVDRCLDPKVKKCITNHRWPVLYVPRVPA